MPDVDAFIARWSASGGPGQANQQLFLAEFRDVPGVARPDPALSGKGQDILLWAQGLCALRRRRVHAHTA